MVKSKKMSKTSIAVIVLAILLVLSLALGITGAWFTSHDQGSIAGGNKQFTLGKFLRLEGGADVSASTAFSIERRMPIESGEHAGELGDYAALNEAGQTAAIVLPGDRIVVTGSNSVTIAANTDEENAEVDFWYVISYDNGVHWVDASDNALTTKAAKGDENFTITLSVANTEGAATGTLVTDGVVSDNVNGAFTISGEDTDNSMKGHTVTITVAGKTILVKAMQYENISAADAFAYLTGNDFADPADNA